MDDPSNPYRTPESPVDAHVDASTPHSARVLLRVLVFVQLALIPLAMLMPDTLPQELRRLRDEREAAFVNTHGALALLSIALLVVSLVGLWLEKRWAVWLYVAANVIGYALQLMTGARIASDLSSFVDSLADAAVGATLVVLYLGGYFSAASRDAPR